jgi:hypothetical protein
MSARIMLWFAVVVMAVEALVMTNLWALAFGLMFAVAGMMLESSR